MTAVRQEPIGILCVDDNPRVAEALRMKFSRTGGFEWRGWMEDANRLLDRIEGDPSVVVLLDLDLPGRNPFEALTEVNERFPQARTVVFTGHVRKDFIERAIEAGAWGYVSKNDGEEALVEALRRVSEGEFVMSDEVRGTWSA